MKDVDVYQLLPGLRNRSTLWVWLVGLGIVGTVAVVTAVEHTAGSVADLRQIAHDIARGTSRLTTDEPSAAVSQDFPLLRDIASWVFAATIIGGCGVLRALLSRLSVAFSDLVRLGAVKPATTLRLSRVSRFLLIDRKVRNLAAADALPAFIGRVNRLMYLWRVPVLLTVLGAAWLLAKGLITAEQHGLYLIVAPEDLSPAEQRAWAAQAYHNWWAGDQHPAGHYLYYALAMLAMALIITFNVVGIIAVYVCYGTYCLGETGADWANRDGRWGWRSVAQVYAWTYWALALQGIALSAVVLLVKLYDLSVRWEYVVAMLWMVLQYPIMIPLYVVLPWFVFNKIQRSAQQQRIEHLDRLMRDIDPVKDIDQVGPVVAEVDRCWAATIRPMAMRPGQWSPFAAAVLLPLVLTVSQIWLS